MKGILFKPESIQAIIEGRKTQTRRLGGLKEINQEPDKWILVRRDQMIGIPANIFIFHNKEDREADGESVREFIKPRYQISETVYVKEAYQVRGGDYSEQTAWIVYPDGVELKRKIAMYYSWDRATKPCYTKLDGSMPTVSPLFMPEWAARHFIKILAVRAERLQEITLEDCQAEGIAGYTFARGCLSGNPPDARWKFIELWNFINKAYPWESNPWVWLYSFEYHQPRSRASEKSGGSPRR